MIDYLVGKPQHYEAIARLHAYSWQQHYRGIFNDEYLDHEVINDRIRVWQRRFKKPTSNQHVILAQDQQLLCGFGCIFKDYDPKFGALLDNLHVHPDWQGKGIGRELMKRCSQWLLEQDPHSKLYLWVLQENDSAIAFYKSLGGETHEQVTEHNPGGGSAEILRIVWPRPLLIDN